MSLVQQFDEVPPKTIRKLQAALRQISEVIDYETQALKNHDNPDFNDIKAKKARGLQTLTQLLGAEGMMQDEAIKMSIRDHIEQLATKLERNQYMLKTHMEAVSELVEMIHSAAHARETDGTYDPLSVSSQTAN